MYTIFAQGLDTILLRKVMSTISIYYNVATDVPYKTVHYKTSYGSLGM